MAMENVLHVIKHRYEIIYSYYLKRMKEIDKIPKEQRPKQTDIMREIAEETGYQSIDSIYRIVEKQRSKRDMG